MTSSIYEPLSIERAEIRLLTLHPGTGDDEIRGTLFHAFLDNVESLDYETISYCWGDPSDLGTIFVNGSQLQIARNTEAALRSVRYSANDRVLWIDGVCINQNNTDERSRQVPLMTEVFANTSMNLACFTDDAQLADEAMDAINSIEAEWEREPDETPREIAKNDLASHFSGRKNAIRSIMDRPGVSAALAELYGQPLFR